MDLWRRVPPCYEQISKQQRREPCKAKELLDAHRLYTILVKNRIGCRRYCLRRIHPIKLLSSDQPDLISLVVWDSIRAVTIRSCPDTRFGSTRSSLGVSNNSAIRDWKLQYELSKTKEHEQPFHLHFVSIYGAIVQSCPGQRTDKLASGGAQQLKHPGLRPPLPSPCARPVFFSVGQSALDDFCADLTALAVQGSIDPVIGRDKEVDRVVEILARRTKNNPILLGEPGVGKTAIAEGLALRIAENAVPAFLQVSGGQ